jgi:hypothetical protein
MHSRAIVIERIAPGGNGDHRVFSVDTVHECRSWSQLTHAAHKAAVSRTLSTQRDMLYAWNRRESLKEVNQRTLISTGRACDASKVGEMTETSGGFIPCEVE